MTWKYTSRRWNCVEMPTIYIQLTKDGDYRLNTPFWGAVFANLQTAKRYGQLFYNEYMAKRPA